MIALYERVQLVKSEPAPHRMLAALNRLVGTWITEATHPALPGVVVHGTATVEWLEGKHFIIIRATTDHPDFPDSISVLGSMDDDRVSDGDKSVAEASAAGLRMHYYDSRGVYRDYEANVDDTAWRWIRNAPGFSQRFTGTFVGKDTIAGQSELCRDDVNWKDDLKITYRRTLSGRR